MDSHYIAYVHRPSHYCICISICIYTICHIVMNVTIDSMYDGWGIWAALLQISRRHFSCQPHLHIAHHTGRSGLCRPDGTTRTYGDAQLSVGVDLSITFLMRSRSDWRKLRMIACERWGNATNWHMSAGRYSISCNFVRTFISTRTHASLRGRIRRFIPIPGLPRKWHNISEEDRLY